MPGHTDRLPVQKHNLLVHGFPVGRGGFQAETLQSVVEQGLADADAGFAAAHAVVERNDLLLRVGQTQVRTDFQRDVRMPVGILAGVDAPVS